MIRTATWPWRPARSPAGLGPEVVRRFFDAYGIAHPDLGRLDCFVLLDEFC